MQHQPPLDAELAQILLEHLLAAALGLHHRMPEAEEISSGEFAADLRMIRSHQADEVMRGLEDRAIAISRQRDAETAAEAEEAAS